MHIDKKTLRNIFLGVISCIVLYWILHEPERLKSTYNFISGILSPFVLGATLAFIINVPLRAIERLLGKIVNPSLRRAIALLMTFLGFLLVLALVFWLLIPQVISTIETLIHRFGLQHFLRIILGYCHCLIKLISISHSLFKKRHLSLAAG